MDLSKVDKNMQEVLKKYPFLVELFLQEEAKKLKKIIKADQKREVGTSKGTKKNWNPKTSYHAASNLKVSKLFGSGSEKGISVYNRAPHAHLVEFGHRNVSRGQKRATTRQGRIEQLKTQKTSGFTIGKMVQKFAEYEFKNTFYQDAELFLAKYVESTISGEIAQTYGGNIT